MKLRILLFLLRNVINLFGSFLPSLQISTLLQKKYSIFMFIGMTPGLLVFKNVRILFLTWHTGRWRWEEASHIWEPCESRAFSGGCDMQKPLEMVLNSCYCKNAFYLLAPLKRSCQTCCPEVFWGIFSRCFILSSYCGKAESGQEIPWNINFTWLLLGRHLKIDPVNCHPASDDYFLIVISPVLLWLTVMLWGCFNLWISWSNSLCQFWCGWANVSMSIFEKSFSP